MGEMTATMSQSDGDRVEERTKPPFLRRVRIKGYRSIAFCDAPLQPLTILVGRNGAGKSNFLDALAFLRDVMDTNVPEAVKRRGGWSSLICRTAKLSEIEIEIEAAVSIVLVPERPPEAGVSGSGTPERTTPAIATYKLRLAPDENSRPTILHESLVIESEPELNAGFEVSRGTIKGWHPDLEPLKAIRPDRPLLGLMGTNPANIFGDGFRYMGFYNFHPEAMRHLQKPSHGSLLEQDGSNLASVIEGLKEIDNDAVERARDYLALINEDVRGFEVATYGEYETVRFDLKVAPESPPLRFDASCMSDGTLRALATLMAAFQIHLPTGPSVIGIEEPETSLHPAAMRALVDAMDEATSRTQVLLTTHSADLLSGRDVTPGQVLVVRSRGGRTQITPVDPASKEIIEKELYSLADLQRMDQLGLDEADVKRQAQMSNGVAGA
jgi:predicted ATPase